MEDSMEMMKPEGLGMIGTVRVLLSTLFALFFVFGQIPAYLPQYLDIRRGAGEAFSTMVSLVLLTANILRLFFWVGKRFEMVLVYQSIVMLIVQFLMLEICVRTRVVKSKHRSRFFTDLDWRYFWSWDDIGSYVLCMAALSTVVGFFSLFLISYDWYVELLGTFALLIESTLGIPQLIRNYKKGTTGLSTFLIGSWLVGDLVKTIYFVILNAPFQFTLCGVIQITVDLLILYQIYQHQLHEAFNNTRLFRRTFAPPSSLPSSGHPLVETIAPPSSP